jgi:hypothetical protein
MHKFRHLLGCLSACAIATGLAGCGKSGPKRYAVSGDVTWRGKPLDHGGVVFLPEDSSLGSSGGAVIKDGRYSISATSGLLAGRYKVMVTSADPSKAPDPEALPGPAGPLPKDRINPKYNAQTVLFADVTAQGPNKFDFAVD